MKYLAMASTALFLLAAPGIGLAQTTTDGSAGASGGVSTDTGSGTNAGVGAGVTTETGGNSDTTGSAPNVTGGANQCSDQTATSSYASFSDKCRRQIDAWAMSQAGASTKFEGDVVVGTVVPDTVEVVEVPTYRNYGYVMLNDRRVLVDRTTHKVIWVY